MPRMARQKSFDAVYNVMARSISEIDLFREDDDKKKYMELIKHYQEIYKFRVYGYCIMDNHMHMIIDANGVDISKIMHDPFEIEDEKFILSLFENNIKNARKTYRSFVML